MSRVVLNRLLLVVTVILVLLVWFLRRDFGQPNYVFTPEMVFSVPYDSFAANPNFNDGKTLQLPVAGTVARGARQMPCVPVRNLPTRGRSWELTRRNCLPQKVADEKSIRRFAWSVTGRLATETVRSRCTVFHLPRR